MNTKIEILTLESTSYLAVRNRFFSTYRRVVLGTTISKDRNALPFGNRKTHGGNAIPDRRLYKDGTDKIF